VVIDRLAVATREVLALPTIKERLTALASEPIWMSPADTDAFVRAEYERWRPVIRAAGVTLE
jgi:tripartite-type tricarboxylate transporter receptor subunit TctC